MFDDVADRLQKTIDDWQPTLINLAEEAIHHRPSSDRWTIAEVVGHLVDSACNNHQRFIRAQESESLTFPKYEQNHWVRVSHYDGFSWPALISLWHSYNGLIAHLMRHVPAERAQTVCTIGPYDPCTLEFLIRDYVDHLEHHLNKIRERLDV